MEGSRLQTLYSKFDVHNFPNRGQSSYIHDRLHLSDITFGKDVKKITEQKFKVVINFSEAPIPDYISNQLKDHGVIYYYINVDQDDPNTDLTDAMVETLVAFRTNAGKTLIHCSAGCSRSAAVALYILCNVYNMSMEDACDLLAKQRPCVCPMPNYISQVYKLISNQQ